jgi:predicted phage terminase large subunit-like protein
VYEITEQLYRPPVVDEDEIVMIRSKVPKATRALESLRNPLLIVRELNDRSLYHFIQWFWPVISNQEFHGNWHIEYLCKELEEIAYRVGNREQKLHDLIINIPPGTTKTITCSIMFPAWCWTKWYWMRFITASYSSALSLESSEYCRDLIRSAQFKALYPELDIKEDKDTKTNFKIVKKDWWHGKLNKAPKLLQGGNRYTTSVGGTLMGFHADIIVWDDPINPTQSLSDKEREIANRWIDQTLPTRKTDKGISTVIGVMQRLHQDDPTGHILNKKKTNVRNISLPGEILNYREQLNPPELAIYYKDNLLDPIRLSWKNLHDLEEDLGQYGYAGQIGQNPTPAGGGMFHADSFIKIQTAPPPNEILQTIRYWDKAGSEGKGAYTVGVKMARLKNGIFVVLDVRRGQWGSDAREKIIKTTAQADGPNCIIYIEQEPGSGGKESAEGTIRNLLGYVCYADRPTGDKVFRADPYSVQVNNGSFQMLQADWNNAYLDEHRFFPYGTYKDQVDASSGAFNHLVKRKVAGRIT